MSSWVVEEALAVAKKKGCPDTFSTSDGTADYCFVEVLDERGTFRADVASLNEGELVVRRLEGGQDGERQALPVSSISPSSLHITYYYKTWRRVYKGALPFLLSYKTRWLPFCYRFACLVDSIAQRRYNSKTLIVQDRHEVLDAMVKLQYDGVRSVSVVRLLSEMNGSDRWVLHPQKEELVHRYTSILKSWVEDGCVMALDGAGYRATPKAISTLDSLRREERRHNDMLAANRRVGWLTAGLVLVGLIQTVVTALN